MEQTTFQQRIEDRARQRLLKDLFDAYNKQQHLIYLIGKEYFPEVLDMREYYSEYQNPRTQIQIRSEKTQEIFDKLLPKYTAIVTDEILKKVDEIDWLVSERNQENNSDY